MEDHNCSTRSGELLEKLFRSFVIFCVKIFYRHIGVRGEDNIPPNDGRTPVIFAGNHHNGLIDPIIVYCTVPNRVIRPVAAAYLFDIPVIGFIIRSLLKAIPVRRRTDKKGRKVDNSKSLQAMSNVLLEGGSFTIFPEGVSHNSTEVLELKTGFARACMLALQMDDSLNIYVVPVGLNYQAKNRFQSDIFVDFGEPIIVNKKHLELFKKDAQQTLSDLTNELKDRLESVVIHASNKEVLTAAHLARMMLREKDTGLTQAEYIDFTKVLINILERDAKEFKDLFWELHAFQTHLNILNLKYEDLKYGERTLLDHVFITLVSLPLSLPGALFHAPIGLISSWVGKKFARGYEDQQAHYKIMMSLILVPTVYSITFLTLTILFGPLKAASTLFFLIISVYFAIIVRPLSFSLKLLSTLPRLLMSNRKALRAENDRLLAKLQKIIEEDPEAQKLLPLLQPRSIS